jgi:PKD repeat protein
MSDFSNRPIISISCGALIRAFTLVIALAFGPGVVNAQLAVNESVTNAQAVSLVENVFVGNCVTVSNVTFTGFANGATQGAVGSFSNGNTTNLGLDDGIVLTSGRASIAAGPNNSGSASFNNPSTGDVDLTAIIGVNTFDAAVLEFDFVPVSNTISFRYVFGSDEYSEYVNAGFNDVFGFFISGPGIAGPFSGGAENIALLPSTIIPVAIDNVNNGNAAFGPGLGPCTNCSYYVENDGGTTLQYDAFTTVLTATIAVQACQTYHIKLVVADAGDGVVDSGVFLEARSFTAGNTVEVDVTANGPLAEGCTDGLFTFTRLDAATLAEDLVVEYTVTGTATSGTDHTAIPLTFTIPAGSMTADLDISATLDFTPEGDESIIITVTNAECGCGAPTPPTATALITDNDVPLAVITAGSLTACLGSESLLTATPSGSLGPYTISWNNGGGTGAGVIVSPEVTTIYTATVTDACGTQTVTSAETVTVVVAEYVVDDAQQCFDANQFNFTNQGASGAGVTHAWNFGDGNSSLLESPSHAFATDGSYTVTHTVTWTASGCQSQYVTNVDVWPMPMATAATIQDETCLSLGEVTVNVVDGTGPFAYAWSPGGATTATVSGLVADTYTVTVTDFNGCTDQSSATVTEIAGGNPTAICQNLTMQLDANGNGFVTAAQVNNGSSDPCGIASITLDRNAFSCADIGPNTVTLTVVNVNGGTATCAATITVEDNFPLSAVCQDITVQLDATGNAVITAAQIDNGSFDNCGIQSMTVSPNAFDCSDIGANAVTLTVTDLSGNVATCGATVTVQETIPPMAICQNITVQLNAGGTATITAAQIDNGSSDNCGIQSIAVSPSTFDCSDIGPNTVTLTVTDLSGNVSTCTATVTIQETTPPTALCQNITVQLNAGGTATITAAQIDNGSTDNCGIQSIAVSPSTFDCADIGANTVTLTVTDISGNVSTCTATVTVQETLAPTAICQNITVQLNAGGTATITAAQIDNGSSDNCGIQNISVAPNTFDCTDIGPNVVTLTVTDLSGNVSTCTATVTVQETTPPTAICQNITTQLDGTGNATITAAQIDNGSSDNCGIQSVTVSPSAFDCSDIGANVVTLTVTDLSGNVATCTATVTVQETVPPTAVCQNITVQLNGTGNATITAAQIDNGSSDNCAIQNITVSPSAFDCSDIGANNVTLTVTDASGNASTCTATVTVQETTPPTAICQNITVQLNAGGSATITAAQIDNGSSDNCGIQSISVAPNTFDCTDIGPNVVTLTVTDLSGNVSTCTATVTVQETTPPTAVCQNITIQLDGTGNATITAAQIDNGSSDNCGIQSITVSPSAFDCSDIGANVVTLTVTDQSGNVSTCTATVTVQEAVLPTAICQNITVQLNAAGSATITAAQIDNGSSDNCGIQSITVSPSVFDCSDIGPNLVTLTVTDLSGNTATCTATVTVQDNIAPTAICQNIIVQLNSAGNATITAAQINNGSSDNCGIQSIAVAPDAFSCADLGANTVTLTVTDINGNIATCSANVTVEDNIAPTAVCQSITVQLDAAGNATITAAQIDNGSSDNCGIQSITVAPSTFTCGDLGVNTVTLTVTDASGNATTCSATVTVEDNIAPTAICQNITVQLNGAGNATLLAAQIDNGSADNCGIQSMTVTPNAFTCANIGDNPVVLTVTDLSGNTATCSAVVTVQSTAGLVALCQNITVQLDASGNVSITADQVDNGSGVGCGSAALSINPSTFTCADLGANLVTLTVTDEFANVATCSATVTVVDNIAPTAVCQNMTVQLDATGNASITAAQIDNGSSDNCGIQSITVSPSTFSCANIGVNTVTLTVTDASGNVATCNATVTVADNLAPTAICQNITVQLNGAGTVSITAAQIDNGSTDNCAIQSMSVAPNTFFCGAVGANVVTLTVTDASGNVSTCTSTVTVVENEPPVAVCQDITVQLNGGGNATVVAAQVDNGSSDNCGIVSMTVAPNAFTCADIGPNVVTLTVLDASGNSSTCTSVVTVQPPASALVAVCQNITVALDATGNVSITAAQVDNGSGVGCGTANLSVDPSAFDCTDIGPNTVTLTVTDDFGNTATCVATVTVVDDLPPSASCQDITVQLDASGNASIIASQIDNGSADNCGIQSISIAPSTFDCTNIGPNTVTLTVTDPSGNVSICTAIVTVQETLAPVAVCQNISIQLDATGNASITAAQIDNGSSDNCTIQSITVSPSTFDCSDIGANVVTLTVVDLSGNTASCPATVTVLETIPPVALCQNITLYLDNNSEVQIDATDLDAGSTDNCAIASLTLDRDLFGCGDIGANTVVLTVEDASGNTSTCSAVVTVVDTVSPSIAGCPADMLVTVNDAECSAVVSWVSPTFTDNCGTAVTASHLSGQSFPIGQTTVAYTATDPSGNTAACSFTITVQGDALTAQVVPIVRQCGYPISCNGAADGEAEVLIAGGCAPYTIAWANGQSSLIATTLDAGMAVVVITDASGASVTAEALITQPQPFALAVDTVSLYPGLTNISCKGEDDGSIAITLSGGADCQAYTLQWSGPQGFSAVQEDILGLVSGNYILQVSDANGCTVDTTITLIEPQSLITAVVGVTDVSCANGADGSIELAVSSGSAPYDIVWATGDTTEVITGLVAGVYTAVVTDANGCNDSVLVIIGEPEPLLWQLVETVNVSCAGLADGQATIVGSGGTAPYTYVWNDGQSGPVATGLAVGYHGFTVVDANACAISDSINIGSPTALQLVQATTTDVTCQGGSDGTATVEVTGGTAPYTYAWSPSAQNGQTATGLWATVHTFEVTDANGCSLTDSISIAEPSAISITISSDTAICAGTSAILIVSAEGGAGGFTYVWNNGLGTGPFQLASPTVATQYLVDVTDANGCTVSGVGVLVSLLPSPTAAFTAAVVDACVLPATVGLTNNSAGATSYTWYQGTLTFTDVEPTLSYAATGNYTIALVATTDAGCTDTATASISVVPLPVAAFAISDTEGCMPHFTTLENTSTGAATYTWNLGDGTTTTTPAPAHSYFNAGSYTVSLIVTSSLGCTDTLTLDSAINVFPQPVADFNVISLGTDLGNTYEFINTSTPGIAYYWDFDDGTYSDQFGPVHQFDASGNYHVSLTATTPQGCVDTALAYVNIELQAGLFVPNAMIIGNDGSAGLFFPIGVGLAQYRAQIYDNWGNLLWESMALINSAPSEGWDGRYKGELVPQGAYTWSIQATFLNGEIWQGMDYGNGEVETAGSVMVLY